MPDECLSIDDPPVRRRLEAARGYCELGLPRLAWEEIRPLRSTLGNCSEVIELELVILMHEKRWTEGLKTAERLREKLAAHPAGWLQAAFCLHELGRTRDALECLGTAPASVRQAALFHYNCACYHAVLGQTDRALDALKRAFEIDPDYRKNAREDPDLVSLREMF